jgi:hypothetical protein
MTESVGMQHAARGIVFATLNKYFSVGGIGGSLAGR